MFKCVKCGQEYEMVPEYEGAFLEMLDMDGHKEPICTEPDPWADWDADPEFYVACGGTLKEI